MSNCSLIIYGNDLVEPPTPVDLTDSTSCACACNCGYVMFENLLLELPELTDVAERNPTQYIKLEAKIRQQIIRISRLFDNEVGVKHGFFSKSHISTITVNSKGRYLKVPPFVNGTLELFNLDSIPIKPELYATTGEYVMYRPCQQSLNSPCGICSSSSGNNNIIFPNSCYKVRARWGLECAEKAVEQAIISYIIELQRYGDIEVASQTGLPVARGFKLPHSWESTVDSYRRKRSIHNRYAIA